jgi:hypothetical protein
LNDASVFGEGGRAAETVMRGGRGRAASRHDQSHTIYRGQSPALFGNGNRDLSSEHLDPPIGVQDVRD